MARAVLNLTSDIVLFFRPDVLRLVDVNWTASRALGYSKRELLTLELPEIVATDARDALATAIRQSESAAAALLTERVALRRRDGSEFPIEATIRRFHRKRQSTAVLVARDATERQCLENLWACPAHVDPLTGLPNRAVLESRLQASAARKGVSDAANNGRLALFLVDLNHFKQVNDRRGHLAGDAVLKIIAERLARCVRAGDMVVRYGGDEFVVLADGLIDVHEAAGLAERIVTAVSRPIDLQSDEVRVSASIGVAIGQASETSHHTACSASLSELLARADQGMYRAKAAGRHGHYIIQDARG